MRVAKSTGSGSGKKVKTESVVRHNLCKKACRYDHDQLSPRHPDSKEDEKVHFGPKHIHHCRSYKPADRQPMATGSS